ncbi:sialate O-acetylesterase [Coraliomargarita sinensis]|uniref:Sialate O-acetylesterase n=1 Tax=Coraliomargarita sinensis TaxID=2174842 RepID=A0A317ZGW4_9BACT|nr:sialate O-acetylesterase [Coraliomargarita sinensis]PXA04680.1 sialate O-acetylesterase [Coraliomargarita sinensis]
MRTLLTPLHLFSILLITMPLARAEVVLPEIFQDHMILQQGVPNCIWGTAEPGERVTAGFAGQQVSAKADHDGNWKLYLAPLAASSEPRELTVEASNRIALQDVLVGEVWWASGQSNMATGIRQSRGDQQKVFAAQKDNKRVRAYIRGKWYLLSEQATQTSAVAFFFALKLEQTLDVPVAYVVVAQNGSKIEPFVPPAEAEAYELGPKSSKIYNERVAPLTDYAIKGVIWYQGESNRGADNYFDSLKALYSGWSRVFEMPELPFYQVQIAPFNKQEEKTSLISDSVWAAQYRAAEEIPGMGIIPLHDTGISVKRIHPRSKQPVGERLAALALKHQYGKDVVTTGPVFSRAIRQSDKILVRFDHVDEGLTTTDGKSPSYFELSSDGKNFVEAEARIKGEHVEVMAEGVSEPEFVRMGWFDIAIPNLTDKNGWPVFAFPAQPVE